jgi:CDP-diacylglycerol---serine O-phosphatidyltransferase
MSEAASGAPLPRPPLHRGVYVLPNLFTTGGLFAGFYSITCSMRGDFQMAAVFILVAQVFDILDGRIARLTRRPAASASSTIRWPT